MLLIGGVAAVALNVAPASAVDRTPVAGIVRPAPGGALWSDAEATALRGDLEAILSGAAALRGAHVGALVLAADDGRSLYERAADDAFQPASTLKLLTGMVALERLGPAYRFATILARAPAAAAGAATSLVLQGGGDPLLRAADLEAAAETVRRAAPAQPVELVLDTSHIAPRERHPPGWSLDDVLAPYAPVVNGLPFEENVLHVQAMAGALGTAPAVLLPPPFRALPVTACHDLPTLLTFTVAARSVAAGTSSTLDALRGRCGDVVLTGDVPAGAPSSIDVAVEQPETLAWMALAEGLRRRGVAVLPAAVTSGPIPGIREAPYRPDLGGAVVWRHDGEPLSDLLADLWLPSDNLIAEMLLRELDVVANRRAGTAAGGLEQERTWLRELGVDPRTTTLVDGSGLSQYDRIAPRALATILRRAWQGPYRELVLDDLPVAARRGSMRDVMRDTTAAGRVFAKTGSMSHVRGMAGFVATRSHGAVIFVLAVDDWLGEEAALETVRAAFCARLSAS